MKYDAAYVGRLRRFNSTEKYLREVRRARSLLVQHQPHGDLEDWYLDFGCGIGTALGILADSVPGQWDGYDANSDVLLASSAVTRTRPNARTFAHRAALGRYRGVTMFHVIGHLENPVAELRRIARHLQPGGVLVIVTPNAQYRRWMSLPNRFNGYQGDPTVLRRYDETTLAKELAQAGFVAVHHQYLGKLPQTWPIFGPSHLRETLLVVAKLNVHSRLERDGAI